MPDRHRLVVAHRLGPVMADVLLGVMAHILGEVVADGAGFVVLDQLVMVLLGLEVDLFRALLVLEAHLVPAAAAGRGVRLPARLRGIRGQAIGRHLRGIVDPAGDDRRVRIALQKVDDHLLPDARDLDEAPARARPYRADPDEAAGVLILATQPVPVELHLNPAELVGEYLLARWPHDNRCLGSRHQRPRGDAVGAESQGMRLQLQPHPEALALPLHARAILVVPHLVVRPQHDILDVLGLALEFLQREADTGPQATHVAGRVNPDMRRLRLFQPDGSQRLAVAHLDVGPGIVVQLAFRRLVRLRRIRLRHQVGRGFLEVIVGVRIDPGPDRDARVKPGDHVVLPDDVASLAPELDRRIILGVLHRCVRVRQDQRVLAIGMVEVVEDPLVLHQPLHEVEVALPILHAVFARRVGFLQPLLDLDVGIGFPDLLDDLDHAFLLENAVVGAVGQKPQPGPQQSAIVGIVLAVFQEGELGDVAVEEPLGAVGLDSDRYRRAQDVFRLDVDVLADQPGLIAEALADLVEAFHLRKEQLVAQCCADCDVAVVSHADHSCPKARSNRVLQQMPRQSSRKSRAWGRIRGQSAVGQARPFRSRQRDSGLASA